MGNRLWGHRAVAESLVQKPVGTGNHHHLLLLVLGVSLPLERGLVGNRFRILRENGKAGVLLQRAEGRYCFNRKRALERD